MDELRECPFCGGHARMGLMCGSVGVTCQLCGASLVNETKETAIAAWNARAPAVPDFDWKSAAERATKRAETAEAELSEARNRIKDFEDAISLLRDDDCLRHVAGWYASVQLCIKLLDAAPRVAAPAVPEGWRDISTAPTEGHVLLGGYVVPSAAAQANGSKIVWHYGIGTALWDGQWSGFLGSRPTHWMPLPAAPKVPTTGMICAAVGEITSHQARVVWPAMLAAAPKVPEGWQPLSTLEHRHAYNEPLVMDGKNMPATYFSDNVILTDGKRVWVERSVIMGGALSSSADKFTAYPSGDKPTHWMPLPAAPKVPT